MAKRGLNLYLPTLVFSVILVSEAWGYTAPMDVMALQDLYISLNRAPQLNGWRLYGGDHVRSPGPECLVLVHHELQQLNLRGYLGGQLHYLHNLKHLDVSSNYMFGQIPYGLPPNVTRINLSGNNLSQSIPHSLSSCTLLRHLNLSHNSLSGPIGNMFEGLYHLKDMDLSYNNFAGDLPSSFGSLTILTGLFLQNNQFTGPVVYLADLPLIDLNIQGNHFSGVIPTQFQSIRENYPPWKFPLDVVSIRQNFSGPPTSESSALGNYPSLMMPGQKKKRLGPGSVALMVCGATIIVTVAAFFIAIRLKQSHNLPITRDFSFQDPEVSPHLWPIKSPPILGPMHVPSVSRTGTEKMSTRKSFGMFKAPASAKIYTVAELQSATTNFSEENLLVEGSLGSFYRAEFPYGQVMAVKNISLISLSDEEEEQFLDVIRIASRLRHPNIVMLVGCCVEHRQHLLVYEYVRNLSLDDVLHSQAYKPLSWIIRLSIALGIARILDYLHSTSVAHGNLKASNILLDEALKPRLCDSRLAVLRPLTSNSVKLKASEIAIGETGYIAPEHGEPGIDNTRSDMYAFGVLLLELLTGRKPSDSSGPKGEQLLVRWASSRLHDRECLLQMVDPAISGTLSAKSLSRYADIVSLCIQANKIFRPPMSEIVESLTSLFAIVRSGAEGDQLGGAFHSTQTRFITSPTVSHVSI